VKNSKKGKNLEVSFKGCGRECHSTNDKVIEFKSYYNQHPKII